MSRTLAIVAIAALAVLAIAVVVVIYSLRDEDFEVIDRS